MPYLLAYVDPGSGSLLLQVLLAGLLSIPFVFRRAITGGLRKLRGNGEPSEGDRSQR